MRAVAAIFLPISILNGWLRHELRQSTRVQKDFGWLFRASVLVTIAITVVQIVFYHRKRRM